MRLLQRALEPAPIRWLLAIAWTAWMVLVLVQPEAHPVVNLGIRPAPYFLERETFFTIAHISGFIVLTLAWWWALRTRLPSGYALLAAIVIAVTISGLTEWLQSFTPDRHPSFEDLAANAAGSLLAALRVRWERVRTAIHRLPIHGL